ncbi:Uncharacterised protein [Porphyromonas crevioricanis]|uniref:Uncharacterized protein n=1 Tax=Porphyromonas crevioricanis TaxID=393921 RepID=A0A2X4PMT3_9PORP|nr:hypothetical protein PORCAN_1210 [Porphyromonas crevioricanis JCM 13913]SQH73705.1 Uncharacterised protein [Porphyromonas crevioricanis]
MKAMQELHTLNRTILELKRGQSYCRFSFLCALNRTILELKQVDGA